MFHDALVSFAERRGIMMKKKVLFVIHDLSVGGAEKVLINLVNNMDGEKFDVTLLSVFDVGVNKQFLNSNIRYISYFSQMIRGNSHIMKVFSPRFLHKIFIKEKYDIEVAYLEGPSARIVAGCPNKETKLVSWIHIEQKNRINAARAFRSFKESKKCYRCFHKIVCVSEAVRDDFQHLYDLYPKPIVLYNTNESEKIRQQAKETVEFLEKTEKVFKLIGVGKIVKNKGFDKLARIHKRFRDEGYPVLTYILGIGPERSKIEYYLAENDLQDSFSFLGYQTNPYKYVSKCDIFVCTSSAEGFSTAATESLIVGTPVVTTPVAGMYEMLGYNNEYGIIAESNETSIYENIKKLLDNPKLLEYYKESAAERGKYFSTENTVKLVEEMLLAL